MKRIVASACLLAVMLMLVACPHMDRATTQNSGTSWPSNSVGSSGTLTQFLPTKGTDKLF